jgi:hypothetical protein
MRSTTFRWTLGVSGAFIGCILLMFGFILAQAHSYLTADVDALISEVANAIAGHQPEYRVLGLDQYLRADPNRVKLGGLFATDGSRMTGCASDTPFARWHADFLKAAPWSLPAVTTNLHGSSTSWNARWPSD